MTAPKMDPERLGALIDGRLGPDERAETLARLTASDDERVVFADTAAVLRALEEEDVPAAAAPAEPRTAPARRRRPPAWAAGLLAAGIVLAVALPLALRSRDGLPAPEATLAAVTAREAFPAGWPNAWPPSRGEGGASDAGAMASRLGAVHLRLQLAAIANDALARAQAAEQAQGLLPHEWATLADMYGPLAGPDATPSRIAEVGREAARRVGEDRFRLGAWAEAARLAVVRADQGFFR
ncbi:MAG TPA: hypothetical protein VNP72_02955, partial [Longimicrobium sp.]|nr:hypothetical protein [Longimicrobium sp.]